MRFNFNLVLIILGIILIFSSLFYIDYIFKKSELIQVRENLVYKNFTIKGISMMPTLNDSNIVLVDLNSKDFNNGDIVVFKFNTKDDLYVKRIIASEKDKIIFTREGNIYLNEVLLNETYIKGKPFNSNDLYILIKQLEYYNNTIPLEHILVMGDNREVSLDSSKYGLISNKEIVGKIVKINP